MTKIMRTFWQTIIIITALIFITSCGEKCKDTETLVRAPESFNQAMHALENYQQWVFTDGEGNYDTLTALGVYNPFWIKSNKSKDHCDIYEEGQREFQWSVADRFCFSKSMLLTTLWKPNKNVGCDFLSDRVNVCVISDLNFNPDKAFFPFAEEVPQFETPYFTYSNITKHNLHVNAVSADFTGSLFFSEEDGIVGYVLQTDTFKLTSLIK